MATHNPLKPTNQNAQALAQFPIDAHLPPGMWGHQVIKLLERNPHLASEAEAQARIKYVSNEALLNAAIRMIRRVAGGQGSAPVSQVESLVQVTAYLGEDGLPADSVQGSESVTIAADIELARIATALKHAHLFRVWAVLLQIARETGKLGVSRVLLTDKLGEYGITVSERNLRRWLYRGHGLYWQLTETTVYFAGQKKLATRLAAYALEHGQPDLIRTNQPGRSRQMYIPLAGSLATFEAGVYAAWLASRNNPTISRAVLQKLFNRTARILRQWEAAVNVTANTNEAQYHPQFNRDVPDHAIMYEADLGNGLTETRFRARTVNTYHAPIIRQHAKRGQGRRILRAVVEVLQSVEPAGICGQGGSRSASTGGLKPTGRLYFNDTAKALRSRKHSGERARYIRLGEIVTKRPKGLWDYAPEGIQHTSRSEIMRPYKGFDRPIYAKDVL